MTFRNRLQYFLVKKLQISNKEAIELIVTGQILVNNSVSCHNFELSETDSVGYKELVLQEAKKLIYVAFYKPRGIETTLNRKIPDNLAAILPFDESLFPVGRLDKESEGLLLLTNDGKIFDHTLRQENNIEKEYIVKVNKTISDDFLSKMSTGVNILGKTTKESKIEKIDEFQFKIILTQGLNRQIRRMCYKLGYEVESLIRIRIGNISLLALKPLEFRYL
ncbi:MAG: pseudouridine synthase [Bacteroidota bacterium]